MNPKKSTQHISLICFFLGTTGIFLSSHHSTYENSKITFIISSLLLGLSLLFLLHKPTSKSNNSNFLVPSLLFLVAIIKVIGLHTKYGLYLGCDSVAEFSVIKYLYFHPHFLLITNGLFEFPLSYIYVYITSLILNLNPVSGPWNFIHLVTNALTVVFLYLLIKRIFNQKVAIISCLAYMYNPAVSIYSLSMTRENLGILFLVASIFIMQIQSEKNRFSATILYIIFIVSLILSHYTTSYYSVLTIGLLFLSGYLLNLLEGKFFSEPLYKHYYILFLVMCLFLWVFNITYNHQGDIRIADQMLKGIIDLFQAKETMISANRETTKIFTDYSIVQTLYKIQAAFLALGSIYLLYKIRELSKTQKIFAINAFIHTSIIALSSFVPSLADSLSPTRIMRFGIVISCITVGYMFCNTNSILKPNMKKIYKPITILILTLVFVYPISSWIANEYMAFSPQPYPYQLGPEMHNIKTTPEIYELDQIDKILPENSTLVLEFSLIGERPYILRESLNSNATQLNDTLLFESNAYNYSSKNYIFLRKSLFQNKQYIFMPEKWTSTPTYMRTINDTQLAILNKKITNNDLIYNEGSYKLIKLK